MHRWALADCAGRGALSRHTCRPAFFRPAIRGLTTESVGIKRGAAWRGVWASAQKIGLPSLALGPMS